MSRKRRWFIKETVRRFLIFLELFQNIKFIWYEKQFSNMGLKEWCEVKKKVEYDGGDWVCRFGNGTELRKEGGEFVVKVLPKSQYDSSKHIKDVFRSKDPSVVSDDVLMFGLEKVELYEGVLVSVPRKES